MNAQEYQYLHPTQSASYLLYEARLSHKYIVDNAFDRINNLSLPEALIPSSDTSMTISLYAHALITLFPSYPASASLILFTILSALEGGVFSGMAGVRQVFSEGS